MTQVRMIPMALAFLGTFAALIAIFALAGRDFTAIWHDGPVTGAYYWVNIAFSPELLIFVFFMITDPQTSPRSPRGRTIFGVATAVVAGALILPQSTEFAIKVAIPVQPHCHLRRFCDHRTGDRSQTGRDDHYSGCPDQHLAA